LPVSVTPENNPCHGFSVIAEVVDTSDKFLTCDNDTGDRFIAGDNDTGEQLSPVTTTLVNNYRQRQRQCREGYFLLPFN
jgi:hypothetical protein